MGDPGQDQLIHILEDGLKGFSLEGRPIGQRSADLPRLDLGKDRKRLDALIIIGDPIHNGPAIAAEFLGGHVKALLFGHLSFLSVSSVPMPIQPLGFSQPHDDQVPGIVSELPGPLSELGLCKAQALVAADSGLV